MLGDFLREPGWAWSGRGPWGPFGEEHGFRKGLLPTRAFIDETTDLVQPSWDRDDPADLTFAATWGLPDRLGLSLSGSLTVAGPRTAPYAQVLADLPTSQAMLGALEAGSHFVAPEERAYLDDYTGVYIVRSSSPEDVVAFWNLRTFGTDLDALPAAGAEPLFHAVLERALWGAKRRKSQVPTLRVWGLDDASETTSAAILTLAKRAGVVIAPAPRDAWPPFIHQGLRTRFTRTVRVDFRATAPWVDVPLPTLPLVDDPEAYTRGVVAAEIRMHSVSGQDPRLCASVPPYRRHSSLLHATTLGAEQGRVTHDGVALGVFADSEHARFPFTSCLDVMALLFDDDRVSVAQSDVGRFQSRAAEKLGGPFSGALNQPATRAALKLAAGRKAGVTLPHLRRVAEDNRGSWPDPLSERRLETRDYSRRQVNFLLHRGFFVPTAKVQCSSCRVESHAAADDLASTMTCEFCGSTYNLALSHSLVAPEWRYRLAAHLEADRVQALFPAIASTSLLRQMRHIEEPPLPHVLGLEVVRGGKKVEADVAVYVPDRDWTLVLGEVKSGNRFDANDVSNLEYLRKGLDAKGVRCLLMFATLKDALAPEETAALRALADRSKAVALATGNLSPNMPLVLTAADLSHPPGSEGHPWRWDSKNYSGLFGTAIASCERNLGLLDVTLEGTADEMRNSCHWERSLDQDR